MMSASLMDSPISLGCVASTPRALSVFVSSLIFVATAVDLSSFREVTTTLAPSVTYKRAAVCPTGPVPAKTVTVFPWRSPSFFSMEVARVFATAAEAVV